MFVPRCQDDVAAAISIARELGTPLLSRGAGTSQCGQTTGAALVKDEPILGLKYQAHEYELQFPEGQIKRVVRIVRNKGRVFYLSVDGPFLTGDTPEVKDFMKSFAPK